MAEFTRHTKTTVRTDTELTLGYGELLKVLRDAGYPIPAEGASIYVRVPGGGDWSNTNLDIGCETDLYVAFTETVETES